MQISDAKIRQWSNGKKGNIRALLSTLHYVCLSLFFQFKISKLPLCVILDCKGAQILCDVLINRHTKQLYAKDLEN